MQRKVLFILLFTAVTAFVYPAYAQISVTSSDILSLIGTTERVEVDTTDSVPVNVGSAGSDQTWDFRTLTITGVEADFEFLSPAGTPFEADFPSANFVQLLDIGVGANTYTYAEVTQDAFSQLGIGTVSTDPDTSFIMERSNDIAPLPLTFGANWIANVNDTTDIGGGAQTVNISTTENTVDGWGTVRLPIGDFPCLRLRENSESISETIFMGSIISSDTTRDISYTWISNETFLLVGITSQPGETDPTFTEASSVSRLTDMSTSVEENDGQQPERLTLLQNYPNPFNPETVIRFVTTSSGPVKLTVYNLLGQRVSTLVDGIRSAGEHRVNWDGRNQAGKQMPGGVYLYRLQTDAFVETRKMILLR